MAVDTAAKRLSALDWGTGMGMPRADGSFANQPDRLHLLSLYSGLTVTDGNVTPTTAVDSGVVFWGGIVGRGR